MRHDQGRFYLAERALGDFVGSPSGLRMRMIWTGLALSLLGVILLTVVGLIWTDLANWVFTIGAVLMFIGLAILVLST
jgi:peptidoglycan/LPS O-acetylase OafA/YrhL